MRHGLYVTIVCYVLLAIVVDRGTRSIPLFVVLERDRLKALVDWCDRLVSEPLVIENSLIPLSRGSFDVIVGMDWLSKRKFVIVCHEKVVRIPLEGDEILQVHGERTQGVVKTLMNTKTRVSYDLVISREEHQFCLLRRGAWSSFEVSVGITEEGEVVPWVGSEMDEAHASRKCRPPVLWVNIGDSSLTGLKLVQETSNKKGVMRFGKKDASLHVPLDEIKVDKTLRFVKEPVENSDREVKRLWVLMPSGCNIILKVQVHVGETLESAIPIEAEKSDVGADQEPT
ncbi:hypothetical protein Tco_0040932 [Tanacetum coccineum]